MQSPSITARLLTAYVIATASMAAHAEPFVGLGTMNVVSPQNVNLGCLDKIMHQVTDTSECAVFNGTRTTLAVQAGTLSYLTLSSTVGQCAPVEVQGSQYQNGGNKILYCGTDIGDQQGPLTYAYPGGGLGDEAVLDTAVDGIYVFLPVNGTAGVLQEDAVLLDYGVDTINPGQVYITWSPQ